MKRNWLITVSIESEPESIEEALNELGAEMSGADPVPMGDDELAITITGPADLPSKVAPGSVIKAVYPSSDLTLF